MMLPSSDLEHVLTCTSPLWSELRGQRLFITGGTGFFGRWLLESFALANARLDLGAEAVVLTRNPEGFARWAPHVAENRAIRLRSGTVQKFDFPDGEYPYVIHAATETGSDLTSDERFEHDIAGMRRVLDFCATHGTRKLLLTSSGAVYGLQPPELTHIPEDYPGAPRSFEPETAYGQAKRMSEFLGACAARRTGLEFKIARCFAFVGPGLPLDAHYAIGNFIRDALAGGPIRVKGDGTPYRSYLYAADLAIWLWTILFRGESRRPYNVGSAADLTILDLAREVAANVRPEAAVEIAGTPIPGVPVLRYVPAIDRARQELQLEVRVPRDEAIRRTAEWYGTEGS